MQTLTQPNYFELFGLAPRFSIDLNSLERSFRQLQSEAHPDKHASHTQSEQRLALQQSTLINDGYQTLRNPTSRAQFLINLSGKTEAAQALSTTFLMSQMEWREAIEEAVKSRDVTVLEALSKRLKHKISVQVNEIAAVLDLQGDFATAEVRVNELRFYEKLRHEIGEALDKISD
ncbi:MAG: Fe-S protein assembly co-chaperone HscB [Methylotenera sp.]|uniref:Fe-S protein assembly co-chaperone HscB n=1 Tax=Methylotenera sp. TaxID=2051956 RepID=UPI0024877D56|nr:Fe-S protein assembly co-chaperone HscB [Methylotenera sp.]MDI1310442.1 Fe-S protein assembly co-chaperone HscB [Methylotenera sp.]